MRLHNDCVYPENDMHNMDVKPVRCQSMGAGVVSLSEVGRALTMGRMRAGNGHARQQR